jgi:hypothetical protein
MAGFQDVNTGQEYYGAGVFAVPSAAWPMTVAGGIRARA